MCFDILCNHNKQTNEPARAHTHINTQNNDFHPLCIRNDFHLLYIYIQNYNICETEAIEKRRIIFYLSLGVSRREDAKECLADDCVESLCASLRSLRYSSPPLLNGKGVRLSADIGFTSTHDSVNFFFFDRVFNDYDKTMSIFFYSIKIYDSLFYFSFFFYEFNRNLEHAWILESISLKFGGSFRIMF